MQFNPPLPFLRNRCLKIDNTPPPPRPDIAKLSYKCKTMSRPEMWDCDLCWWGCVLGYLFSEAGDSPVAMLYVIFDIIDTYVTCVSKWLLCRKDAYPRLSAVEGGWCVRRNANCAGRLQTFFFMCFEKKLVWKRLKKTWFMTLKRSLILLTNKSKSKG